MRTHTWTVAEAKARLSEILRRASSEGPQRIGTRKRYVLVPEDLWEQVSGRRQPLGQWLVENMPRGQEIELPDRSDPPRPSPFETEEA